MFVKDTDQDMLEIEILLFRLLKAFPVKVLKQYFEISELRQDNLIKKIINNFSKNQIIDFSFANFGYLKQHIYIVSPNKEIKSNWIPLPPNYINDTLTEDKKAHNLLFTTVYDVFNSTKNIKENVHFYVPVQIRKFEKYLILSVNILERSLSNLEGDNLVLLNKRLDEQTYIEAIKESLPKGITFVESDLNKGIKSLWKDDYVDAAYVKFKKSKSTSTEAMDETNTLKVIYPEIYKKIMESPIDKEVLSVLHEKVAIKRFSIEPCRGKISINRFPETSTAIVELVDLILLKN